MIKVQATINGVISKSATVRTASDGKKFIGFPVKLTVPGSRNNMPGKELTVSVSKDGDESELPAFAAGTRIEATGTLTFRKTSDNLFFNFHADTVVLCPESDKDAIKGTLEFKGTVGKGVDERTDKKGGKYVSFSAYSTEKSGDALQFTWVRFIKFNYVKEAFLEPKMKIHATGKLTVSAYNGRIDLDCRLEEIKPWERQPFTPAKDNEKPPF
ncbi:hypothetical protein HMPREF1981_00618 [Bacteroides pyogenes F0041]|uniref:Single-strand binding family protein n=1 Tax=Bacteroides pyogenes F0041 TaxID=1321819 RepID=U2CCM6_9BACE|nr:hypothetical protein [Bacteroides pyogenes]ERI88234.1 hypothetical protein HMPREF1981_00618 [Bacteroides pyogenes F0041]